MNHFQPAALKLSPREPLDCAQLENLEKYAYLDIVGEGFGAYRSLQAGHSADFSSPLSGLTGIELLKAQIKVAVDAVGLCS